jgi:A nuclease of the HNH/ENDO VII superfamily with conserved WHH
MRKFGINPDDIYAGDVIKIPVTNSCPINENNYNPPQQKTEQQNIVQSIKNARDELHKVDMTVYDRIQANYELNSLEALIKQTSVSQDPSKLKSFASKLDELVTKYSWAPYVLSLIKVGISGIMGGPAGLVRGTFIEGKGYVVGEATGYVIQDTIIESAKKIMNYDSSLTEREAVVLASSLLSTIGLVYDVKSVFGGMKSVLNKMSTGGGIAHATAGVDANFHFADTKIDLDSNNLFRKADIPDTVQKVGDRFPINAEKAGKTYHFDDLPDKTKVSYPNLHIDYPDGVRFDELGFTDFKPYAIQEVKLDKFNSYDADFSSANKLAGLIKKPDGYTWHHHQDGKTMQLIPEDLHKAFKHTGGMSTTKHGVNK